MDESEKSLSENLKNFDILRLIQKGYYAEISINDSVFPVYIVSQKENQKFEIFFQGRNHDVPMQVINIFGENDFSEETKQRKIAINISLYNLDTSELLNNLYSHLLRCNINLYTKNNTNNGDINSITSTNSTNTTPNSTGHSSNYRTLDKKGKIIDLTGFMTYQTITGLLLDCFVVVMNNIENNNRLNNYKPIDKNLLMVILDTIIYLSNIIKSNLDKYKTAFYNRRLLVVSQIYAILICFDSLIKNLTPKFHIIYNSNLDLEKKLDEISNLVYEILILSKKKWQIPLQSLIIFIKFISSEQIKECIENYDKKEIYEILNGHMKNLDKNELLFYKRDSGVREICNELISNLFDNNMDTYINETYYSYLLSCLKCNNLEKKMNALNDISNIINEFQNDKKINGPFKNFIEKNNIIDMFFEESTHDEVIKRSINIFAYLARYNCLNDNIIKKIIQKLNNNNELMKKILIEIIKELPKEKKDLLFNRLSQGLKFDINNTANIDYILKLTQSCFDSSDIEINETNNTANSNTINTSSNTNINESEVKGNKESENKNNIDDENVEMNKNNYYGLNVIFNYITKDFDDSKSYDKNNIDIAINSFVDTILYIIKCSKIFKIKDIFYFIEKLFENIKYNNKYNSIIQSIKIIHKIFLSLSKKKNKTIFIENLKLLDKKYDIITLLINDLIRYMKILPNDYSNDECKNDIYEGIYPHYKNIEHRLDLIFFFFKKNLNNYGLELEGKKHIEKIYEVFKLEKFSDERKKLYSNITKNINLIDNKILMEFYQDTLKNKNEFDLKSINDTESTNLIIQIFKQINFNLKTIFDDGRNIRVGESETIEGMDMLFDLLTQNSYQIVQDKISQLLCDICLSHKNYSNPKISEFWKNYFNKINIYLDNINKTNDKTALNGIIKLINKIYLSAQKYKGKKPEKKDIKIASESYKVYNFMNSKKDKKIRVGNNERLIEIRWRIAYYFDIHVNNVAFIDTDERIYTLNDDFLIFKNIFSDERYFYNKGFEYVKIKEIPFGLLKMEDNPKLLIETNDKIYNILINNLKIDNNCNNEMINKQKLWNILSQLPKNYYFENKIKKFGKKFEKEKDIKDNTNEEFLEIFNIKQLYLLTYSLQCFNYALFIDDGIYNENDDNENNSIKIEEKELLNKDEFLDNILHTYHLDKLIIEKLIEINIDIENCHPIQIECLSIIINVLMQLENYKEKKMKTEINDNKEIFLNDEKLYNSLLKKLSDIISNLLGLDYDKYKNYLMEDRDELSEEDNESIEDDLSEEINEHFEILIDNIFQYIDEITKNKKSFMNFIFDDKELFIKIFINDYIKCENDSLKHKIKEYLLKSCEQNNDTIKNYLEIILTEDIFNYLIKNDLSGKYFKVINTILISIFDKKECGEGAESIIEPKHIIQAKKLIDIIINYIQNELDKDTKEENDKYEKMEEKQLKEIIKNKEFLKGGIIQFLSNILIIKPNELVNYIITKVDIYDFFLIKCIFRKCLNKPLEAKEPFCLSNKSKDAVFKLILNILKNIDKENHKNLYIKVLNILDNYHKLGFWKGNNWEIESKEMTKSKYVGLKNMNSTCYLNSIVQQLFMIPTFRETIIKIENPYNNNVLYELQLLFSALKIYEFPYYNPKSFVLANNLNFYEQMDADEYYCTLIDKIENDIKKIYCKKNSGEAPLPNSDTQNCKKNENYKYKDIFNYFFGIKVLDELHFVDCGHKRYNEFCYNNIKLEIKDFSDIHESLKNYFKTEVMDHDNKINCEQCNTKRTCHKHLLLKTLPNILVISLNRFEFNYDTMLKYKLNKYFEFPLQLDMKDYLIESHTEKNTEYELTGITIHFGVSDFGHYYDLIKGNDNKWYKFNDIHISEFKEEDIPKEAYGDKDYSEDDSYREKENGRNNAYILFYTKKINEMDKSSISGTDLALPPYNKYSNLKKDIIEKINIKLYKSWIIKNLFSSSYQDFIIGLIKMDIAKIIDSNIEKTHDKLTNIIKNEGYMKEIKEDKNDKIKDKNLFKIINYNNDSIFKFCLRYYFNILLRLQRKNIDKKNNIFENFKELINIYIENDMNKAKYILEEFCNQNIILEYLVYCPNFSSSNDCYDIITESLELLFENKKYIYDENSILYLFLNTLITFIANYLKKINLENVNNIFYKLIEINGEKFIDYLRRKKFNQYVFMLYKNSNSQEIFNSVFNDINLPLLKCNHSILNEKLIDDEKMNQNDDNDNEIDQRFYEKIYDSKSNEKLKNDLINLFLYKE